MYLYRKTEEGDGNYHETKRKVLVWVERRVGLVSLYYVAEIEGFVQTIIFFRRYCTL